MKRLLSCISLLALGIPWATAGCGGGTDGAGVPAPAGTLVFSIHWPEAARLIPLAANSIKIVITVGQQKVAEDQVARPPAGQNTTSRTFTGLPAGDAMVTATAYPNVDSTGVPQAAGSVAVTIEPNATKEVNLTLYSTITNVTITPSPPGGIQLGVNGEQQVTATATDVAARVVLVHASTWLWTSNDPAVATVQGSGDTAVIKGVKTGDATVTAKERESGKQAQLAVGVVGTPSLTVSPQSLEFGTTQTTNSLTVTNAGTGTLSWSVAKVGSAAWLAVSPGAGNLDAGQSQTVTVTVDRTGQGEGGHSETLHFTSNDGSKDVSVVMQVATSPKLSVSPSLLDFGVAETVRSFVVENVGGGTLSWSLTEQNNASWLGETPSAGTVSAGQLQTVAVTVNRSGVAEGTHSEMLLIASNGGGGQVDVIMTKAGGPGSHPWPMFRGDAQHTGRSAYLGAQAVTSQWAFATANEVRSSPAVGANGMVYITSRDRKVYALDAADLTWKWDFPTGYDLWSSPAIAPDGTVYFGSGSGGGTLYALDGATGNEKWRFVTTYGIMSSPAIAPDGTIYFGSDDNGVYALYPTGSLRWRLETGDPVTSSPALGANGMVYVGSQDWTVYAIDATTGSKKWAFRTAGPIDSSPAVAPDGTVYVGSWDKNLYALNGATGAELWRFGAGHWVASSPAIGWDGTVYVGSQDGKLYAIDGATGTRKWAFSTGGWITSSPAIGSDGRVYFGSCDYKVYAIH